MLAAPIPEYDKERVAALHALQLLDTEAEERFDRVTRIASQLLDVPIALVSLVDENRQWFKSKCGLGADETGRDVSFCGHAILKDELFLIPDSLKDPRFADNPLVVGPPHVIFYAGMPLKAKSGYNVGTLCMIDNKPRTLSESQLKIISDIAKIAESEINVLTLTQALIIQKESEEKIREVMDNVEEGLFSITPDLKFGPKHSAALTLILKETNFADRKIIDVFRSKITIELLHKTTDYLELMFQASVHEDMVNDLNPLKEIEFNFGDERKILRFKINRVIVDGKITHLVATVTDFTKQANLAKQITEAEAKTQSLMEKMFDVLHVEPRMLKDFLDGAGQELKSIEEILEGENSNLTLKEKIESIFRSIHSVKGDAALLGLNMLVENAHGFEDKVSELKKRENLTGEDFLVITVEVGKMNIILNEIYGIIQKLSNFQSSFGKQQGVSLLAAIDGQVNKLAKNSGKEIRLEYSKFDSDSVPLKFRKIVKDILIQFIRNSIDHGIETPNVRESLGKSKSGLIEISTTIESGKLELRYSDDGNGLNLEKIKTVALKSGKVSENDLNNKSSKQIEELIYIPGLSTADQITTSSGRGIGMDIVKKRVEFASGNIKIESIAGKSCSFLIELPI
jgi:HPt (histidine-containing phosphotransfer) domain-containing protein